MPKLIEMGQITTLGIEGERADYKMALLIEFDTVESIRKAISEGMCRWDDVPEAAATEPKQYHCGDPCRRTKQLMGRAESPVPWSEAERT